MLALRIARGFNSALGQADPVGYRQDSYSTWRSQISEFRDILGDLGIKDELPTDLHDRISREVYLTQAVFGAIGTEGIRRRVPDRSFSRDCPSNLSIADHGTHPTPSPPTARTKTNKYPSLLQSAL